MDAKTIITDDMTLDEKLAAIDAAMQSVESTNNVRKQAGLAPTDPASLTICDGCE